MTVASYLQPFWNSFVSRPKTQIKLGNYDWIIFGTKYDSAPIKNKCK